MRMSRVSRFAMRFGVVGLVVCLCASRAAAQDPTLKPTFGTVELKAGFPNDPYSVKVIAGGNIETKLGGVRAWVAKEPDFRLKYTKGAFKLTIYAESKEDTTLLINTPDGKWIADDDGGGFPNPLIRFDNPMSGQYDIWVGTFNKEMAPAVLKITELK